MIDDALAGKIDLIVTKSVSRFARNTVDSLTTIRKLKEHGVECFFEKEYIWTFDGKGELLITIMSSMAQEESRSISVNVTWGHRKRMADGKVSLAYSTFLGYGRGEDGALVINPEQAEIVWLIYRSFMDGLTPSLICRMLEERGSLSPGGKKKWNKSTVLSILSNEKYRGDALLQKTFTVDFLTKKHKVNEGEVPQYYVHGNHEAIISPEEFERVQLEIERRRTVGHSYSASTAFASRIVCGDCGAFYGKKVWHSTDRYRRVIWRCNCKYARDDERCNTQALNEDDIKALFLKAYNLLMADRDTVAADCQLLIDELSDTSSLDAKNAATQEEMDNVVTLNKELIRVQAARGTDPEEFNRKATEYDERFRKAEARLARLQADNKRNLARSAEVRSFVNAIMEQPLVLEEWDEQLWKIMVSRMTVHSDGRVVFTSRGKNTITARAE